MLSHTIILDNATALCLVGTTRQFNTALYEGYDIQRLIRHIKHASSLVKFCFIYSRGCGGEGGDQMKYRVHQTPSIMVNLAPMITGQVNRDIPLGWGRVIGIYRIKRFVTILGQRLTKHPACGKLSEFRKLLDIAFNTVKSFHIEFGNFCCQL